LTTARLITGSGRFEGLEPASCPDAVNAFVRLAHQEAIPTYALERAQELLYYLSEGVTQGRLAKSTQVYLDSPMAISATEIFRRHPECFEPATAKVFQEGRDPFALPGLHFTRETAESVAINSIIKGGAIIMAGSGMCTGGRVRHHLQRNLGREDSSIVFVGYAAVGTLARRIIDGAKQVNILGEDIPVRARIYTITVMVSPAMPTRRSCWLGKSRPAQNARSLFTAKKTS
jgi:metallo-beta-lactamase family protein